MMYEHQWLATHAPAVSSIKLSAPPPQAIAFSTLQYGVQLFHTMTQLHGVVQSLVAATSVLAT